MPDEIKKKEKKEKDKKSGALDVSVKPSMMKVQAVGDKVKAINKLKLQDDDDDKKAGRSSFSKQSDGKSKLQMPTNMRDRATTQVQANKSKPKWS